MLHFYKKNCCSLHQVPQHAEHGDVELVPHVHRPPPERLEVVAQVRRLRLRHGPHGEPAEAEGAEGGQGEASLLPPRGAVGEDDAGDRAIPQKTY